MLLWNCVQYCIRDNFTLAVCYIVMVFWAKTLKYVYLVVKMNKIYVSLLLFVDHLRCVYRVAELG